MLKKTPRTGVGALLCLENEHNALRSAKLLSRWNGVIIFKRCTMASYNDRDLAV